MYNVGNKKGKLRGDKKTIYELKGKESANW